MLKIGGYTDSTGSAETNKKVSEERASAALASLVKQGTAAERLKADGYGPEYPIATNTTPEGRALNRRIDLRVTKK
jgi:outer membrane protein OmpA-like peptidoglycan-associated protein